MKRIYSIIAAAAVIGSVCATETDTIICRITGTVIGRPECEALSIMESGHDFRINGFRRVKIVDGKFSYILRSDAPRSYELFFYDDVKKYGGWRNISFISGNGDIEMICYDREREDSSKIVSSTVPENLIAKRFDDIYAKECGAEQDQIYAGMDSLFACGAAYTPEYRQLLERQKAMPKGVERDSLTLLINAYSSRPKDQRYSREYLEYENRSKNLLIKRDSLVRAFISENPSVFGLNKIKQVLLQKAPLSDIDGYVQIFENIYKDSMAEHPYVADITQLLEAKKVKAGNKYPDYKITRPDGSTEMISSLIKGNVAVIDLWASWCGPCRRHSMELIPIYEKYKDRGFKVVAIAREIMVDLMDKAMKKDGYPWESFVDLNDSDGVWRKNGAANSGGKIILVGADGVIVGTDMSVKEIEEYLVKHYDM